MITLGTSPREFRPVTPDRGTGYGATDCLRILQYVRAAYIWHLPDTFVERFGVGPPGIRGSHFSSAR
jgi:hypothetical protein